MYLPRGTPGPGGLLQTPKWSSGWKIINFCTILDIWGYCPSVPVYAYGKKGKKRHAVPRETAVNFNTHCLGTVDIPGQVVYLSRSQYTRVLIIVIHAK